jgi:integrase
MARERTGFIVVQVWAMIEYTDQDGQRLKITKRARIPPLKLSAARPRITDTQVRRVKEAKRIIRETIAEVTRSGAKDCKGAVDTRIFARVGYTDEKGKRRDIVRAAASKSDARDKIKDILRDLEAQNGAETLNAARMTFADLVTYFRKHYLKPAEYVDGRKIEGVRSLKPAEAAIKPLQEFFGRRRLQSIRYADLRAYRAARLREPTSRDIARHRRERETDSKAELRVTRKIATVNRELDKLRRMFSIALREGWIRQNPFAAGESLISIADEHKRERILTRDEERRLLTACLGPHRKYLRPIVLCALDTGMRRGEILSLRWRDVDLEHGLITIQAFNTKTMRERQVALTARLASELEALWQDSPKDQFRRVFGITDNVKRSFESARNTAGLADVRFHDLRHTHATRLVGAHIPLSEVGRVLGHTQPSTTFRYVNANAETARRASAALDAFNAENEPMQETSDVVN